MLNFQSIKTEIFIVTLYTTSTCLGAVYPLRSKFISLMANVHKLKQNARRNKSINWLKVSFNLKMRGYTRMQYNQEKAIIFTN